jgi:hypothetical protein
MEKELAGSAITSRFVGSRFILEGIAENDCEADRAVEIAKALLGMEHPQQRSISQTAETGTLPKGNSPTLIDLMRIKPRPKK